MAYLTAAIVMTLSVLKGHSPMHAFSSAIFCICDVSCSLSHLQSFLLPMWCYAGVVLDVALSVHLSRTSTCYNIYT